MKALENPQTFVDELRRLGVDAVVNYYLLEGIPAFFANNWEGYCQFKEIFANKLNVHPKTVMLVGSGRWGFSTSPDKFPQLFDKGEKQSDLDVVIADSALFDRTWRELCEYEMNESPKGVALENFQRRRHLLYRGTLDPTTFPIEMNFHRYWNDILKELSEFRWNDGTSRRVEAWIFKDWHFLQKYYRQSFHDILEKHLRRI